jgi:hypothetical protein
LSRTSPNPAASIQSPALHHVATWPRHPGIGQGLGVCGACTGPYSPCENNLQNVRANCDAVPGLDESAWL